MTADASDGGDWAQLKQQTRQLDDVQRGLQSWMRNRIGDDTLTVGPLSVPGGTGVANETLLFDVSRSSGSDGFVLRLSTPDPLYLDYRLSMHYGMYEAMMTVPTLPTPAVIGYECDATVIGSEFFVMERIDGVIPTDSPSWATEGFVVDASPSQRRQLWERTVGMLADVHRVDSEAFAFLRTYASADGVGDCLDYWNRSLGWAAPPRPVPLTDEAEQWLAAHRPSGTSLSWGDSRLANVIYRDYTPVGLLDWDLASLAGPQADLAWWILMTPPESLALDGIGSHDEFIDLWEELSGLEATDLQWFLVFGAYRLAAIMAKLLSMFVADGRMPAEMADAQLSTGIHVQLLAGLLELTPPAGVTPMIPDVRWERK